MLSVCQILAGLSCLSSGFVPEAYFWVRMTLALVGKMGASAAFAVVFVYTCELFHTPVRNSAMGENIMISLCFENCKSEKSKEWQSPTPHAVIKQKMSVI